MAQFFLWKGKAVFNLINAFAGTLLVAEIYWCIRKGKVSFSFDPKATFWIFFALWAFTPGFTPVFLWLTGACNYLWTCVLLLGFVIPYIKKYYFPEEQTDDRSLFAAVMFLFGLVAGWTNENSVCWLIVTLFLFLLQLHKKNRNIDNWMYAGLTGLVIGYVLLVFAPGNILRLHLIHGFERGVLQIIRTNCSTFLKVVICQLFLWYFLLRFFYGAAQVTSVVANLRKERLLVSVFAIISLGMTAVMLLAPEFPERSGIFGTIWLIVAVGNVWRLQKEYKIELIQVNAKKFLAVTAVLYFIMTSAVTLHYFYEMKEWQWELLVYVQQAKTENKNSVLIVTPCRKASKTEVLMSGFHIINNDLSEDVNSWENVAFARYYGIKGIQSEKVRKDETILQN